jgi:hypothetical protein
MLKSYSAEISGSQLIWIDQPPPNLTRQPVLVVIENSAPQADTTQHYDLTDLVGRLTWQVDATEVQRRLRDATVITNDAVLLKLGAIESGYPSLSF